MYFLIKRFLDIIFSIVLLASLLPVFLALMVAIKYTSKGPVFFSQKRIGKNNKIFKMLKFRTMIIGTPPDIPTYEFSNVEEHLTPVGSFLRSFSLDELPQLLNILKGDMSFVGLRPAMISEIELIKLREGTKNFKISLGITGFAQINGRSDLFPKEVFGRDLYYLKNISFLLDFKIVLKTIIKVLKKENVYFNFEKHATQNPVS